MASVAPAAARIVTVVGLVVPLAAACARVGVDPGPLAPRYLAVHNTLSAMGLVQVGPIQSGSLQPGAQANLPLELAAGCTTVVALGDDALRVLEAEVRDAQGRAVAHATTAEPQAVVKVCIDTAGTYQLVLRAASGAGRWMATSWQGAVAPTAVAGPASAPAQRQPTGTCEAPLPLSVGTISGSTTHGEDGNTGSCERSDARELVYELDVTERQRVVLDVEAHFDSVLYIRKENCADTDAEVECNDDAPGAGRNHSRIERVLEPGKYFVFVDGYNQEAGPFKLTLSTADVISLSDACRSARPLLADVPQAGSLSGATDDAQATCGGGAPGRDTPYRIELPVASRVRVVEHSDGMKPVVHLRRACADGRSEVACGETGARPGEAAVTGVLPAGLYTAFADAMERDAAGSYELSLETGPREGAGVVGDGCGDALPLAPGGASVSGDTFSARDDVAGSCGGAGAPDVVYYVDVAHRSRLVARFDAEEGPHLLALARRCGDRDTEVACGRAIDEILAPGTYALAVDGLDATSFGRFALTYALRDLTGQVTACGAAPTLVEGRAISGTTVGALDRFSSACAAASDTGVTGPDRVYRFTLAARAVVEISLDADFEAFVSLRRACADVSTGSELTCSADADPRHRITLERPLDPGTYYVVVDGSSASDQGSFAVRFKTVTSR